MGLSGRPRPWSCQSWLGGPGSRPWPEGLWHRRSRDGLGWGWGCPPGSAASRGWGLDGAGGGERRRLGPPTRPALLSSPFGRPSNAFQMWSGCPARAEAGGGGAPVPLSAPPPLPRALPLPGPPVRTGWSLTSLGPVTLCPSWPGGLNLKQLYSGPSPGPWNWRRARDPLYSTRSHEAPTVCQRSN